MSTQTSIDRDELFIGGAWVKPRGSARISVTAASTEEPVGSVPEGTNADIDAAVSAARAAFDDPSGWSSWSAEDRAQALERLAGGLESRSEEIAQLVSLQNGMPISFALQAEAVYPALLARYYAGLIRQISPEEDRQGLLGGKIHVVSTPVGVVGAIVPWNYPQGLAMLKLAPALAAGCTVVIKPSEFTSASLLEFMKLVIEPAEVPAGVINVVTGYGAVVGEPLITHPKVAKVAFTGGTVTGARVNELAAKTFKKVSLELGGKSPNIVFDDCVLEDAVSGAISGIFAATGQTCIAGSRLLLQETIHDQFVEKLVDMARQARLGDPAKLETQVGPVTTPAQYQKILSYIDIAKGEGARCVLGGGPATKEEGGGQYFVKPTIFTGVNNKMRIAQEEVFGPVLSIIKFKDEAEAVAIANDIAYGLGAGLWTQSVKRATSVSKRIRAGTVWVNTYRAVSFLMPFGGYKASGLGRENGAEAIEGYLQTKSVWINNGPGGGNPFIMKTS